MADIPLTVIQRMVSAGLSGEQIGEVCAAIAEGFSKPVPEISYHDIALTPAERARRYRQRQRHATVTEPRDAGVTEAVKVDGETVEDKVVSERDASRPASRSAVTVEDFVEEFPSPEKVSPTPPLKQTPTLPSGDKSPSGDSPGAHVREAASEMLQGELLPALPAAGAVVVRPRRGVAPPVDEAAFERFWAAYPRRVGRKPAMVAFAKACAAIKGPEPPVEVILRGLEASIRSWRERGTAFEYIPHPSTWLNNARWEDDHGTNGYREQSGQFAGDRRFENMARGLMEAADRRRE